MADYIEFDLPVNVPYYEGYKVLDGYNYRISVKWNLIIKNWYLNISSISDPTIKINGIAMLPGRDLLRPYGYGHLLGALWIEDTAESGDNPTYEGMGDRWRLRYYPRGT